MNDGFQPAVIVSVFDGFGGPFLGTLSGGHLRIHWTHFKLPDEPRMRKGERLSENAG